MSTNVTRPSFPYGSRPVITAVFTDAAGASATPTAITVKVRTPAGSETTYTSPNGAISVGATSTFTYPAAVTTSGLHTVAFQATAGVVARAEIEFQVERTAFASP